MKLGIGVIGLGHWGPNIVRNIVTNPRLRLVAVCDKDDGAYRRVAHLTPPDCPFVTDATAVFENPQVDAVAVVTPASQHSDLTRRGLIAGKHVYCEKPFALKVDVARSLCDMAEKRGLKLMVGYTFLYNRAVRKVKSLIQDQRLGQVYYIHATRTHLGLVREDVDVVWDLASHDIAILSYLLGMPPAQVSVLSAHPLGTSRCDVAFIGLSYPNGVIAQIHVSWVDANKQRMIEVVGSKARIVFDDLDNLEPVRIFEKGMGASQRVAPEFGAFRYLVHDGDIISPKVDMAEPLGEALEGFVSSILDGRPTVSDGRFATDVIRALSAARLSMESGGIPREAR